MKKLIVYYSKTGTTRKVAQAVIAKKGCDYGELQYVAKHKSNIKSYDLIVTCGG